MRLLFAQAGKRGGLAMDVTVAHLNNRLALQIPTELPLGLVFVVGKVSGLHGRHNGRSSAATQFTLIEQDHQVRCVLSARAAAEVTLQEGDMIRAGGHLAFDPRRADYYLRVRDVEIVPAPLDVLPPTAVGEREVLVAALAEVRKRSAVSNLPQSDLPPWVRRLAPPEIRAEMAQEEGETAVIPPLPIVEELSPLNDTLIKHLSAAMDSDEEVELTPDLLANLAPSLARRPSPPSVAASAAAWPAEAAAKQPAIGYEDPDAYLPRSQRSDRLMIWLLIGFVFLSFLLILVLLTTI